MANFDFVEATSRSYSFVWHNRVEVFRLSSLVLSVKIVSFIGLIAFGMEQNVIRQGLIFLPSYLLEGWAIAHIIVMAIYKADGADTKTGFSLPVGEDIENNIKASMIIYVLTKLTLSFVLGVTFSGQGPDMQPTAPEPSLSMFVLAMGMLVFMVWAFRFLWLYVPYIFGVSAIQFLNKFKAFGASFNFIGVWLLCFVPLVLAMIAASEVLGFIATMVGLDQKSIVFESMIAVVQAFTDYGMALFASLGVAYGIFSVLKGENKKTSIW